jgi:hypothetical protein
MHTGMLWLNNNPKMTLEEKISQAVDYYVKKYGRQPDLCLVHPSLLASGTEDPKPVKGVTIRPYRPVLPGHIWIGLEDKS